MVQLIHKTANGKTFRCDKCNAVHIEYKNLSFNFSEKQFREFAVSMQELDGDKWEKRNKHSYYTRKILIPTGQKSFSILLNSDELEEFKSLLSGKSETGLTFKVISIVNFSSISFYN